MSAQSVLLSRLAAAVLLLTACAALAATRPAAPTAADSSAVSATGDYTVWTKFSNAAHALVAEGDALWIAGSNRVTRWDRPTATAEITTLPQHDLFAAASAPDGALWFGGRGGLSRRAPDGAWTHLRPDAGPSPDAPVIALAVSADGMLYALLGDRAGPVLRYDPTAETWEAFPNRQAAVVQDYARILTTRAPSALWTVLGAHVWVDWSAYNGATWQFYTPPCGPSAVYTNLVATPDGRVWTGCRDALYAWNGALWEQYELPFAYFAFISTLAAAPDDVLWIGRAGRFGSPYDSPIAAVLRFADGAFTEYGLTTPGAPTAILATAEGAAAVGPGWLWFSTPAFHLLPGAPRYAFVDMAFTLRRGTPYLANANSCCAPRFAALQEVDDRGTYRLEDDAWRAAPLTTAAGFQLNALTALEETPAGYLWIGGYFSGRFDSTGNPLLLSPSGGVLTISPTLPYGRFDDIFAVDDRHTVFAWSPLTFTPNPDPGILLYDNNNTPADQTDDVWSAVAAPPGDRGVVARDAFARIWYGSSAGLFRRDQSGWTQLRTDAIDDLATAADGTIYARFIEGGRVRVAVYHPSGATETLTIDAYGLPNPARYALLHKIVGHNRIVAHAPDGWDWFLTPSEFLRCRPDVCERYPHPGNAASSWSVDGFGRPWMAADGAAWRLSRPPGFALSGAELWLVAPGTTRVYTVATPTWEGFTGEIAVAVQGLPADVTAVIAPNPVAADGAFRVALTAGPGAVAGRYPVRITGVAGNATAVFDVDLQIVPEVHDLFLAIIRR